MKTLGIKFEVAGVKEAKANLNNLRDSINDTLEATRKDIKRSWREWKIQTFGTTSQKQNLTIRQERREFKERSTYKQLSINNRGLVLEFRLAYKDFFQKLGELLDDKQNPNIFEKTLGFLIKPISFAIGSALNAILFPFQSALAGAFERIGEVQVQDLAEGFSKQLQRALGLSFEETGADIGNVIGKSLYKVYQKSIDMVDDYVKGKLQFNLADTLIDAFKNVTKTLAKELPALALRTHRRIQINKKAIPEARRAAGLKMIENDLPEGTRKDIEENNSITLVYGGANTDNADIGKDYTARVMKPYLKGSAVIPMTRQWTNSAVDSEFQGDIRNLIKLILSNQTAAQTFKGFIAENGLSALPAAEQQELMAGLDLEGEIDLSSLERLAELIESLMGNKDFALGKALQATFKGYNPDDVLGAAEAIALMEQFPDKPLQIGGFSHGGYNALGVVDLLNRMGYTNVKGFSIGTPITGANATVNPDNFRAFMGDRDYYYQALMGLAGDEIDFPEFFEVGEKEGNLHSLQGYVRGDSVKGGLQEFLGDRVSIPSKAEYGKHDSAYGYAVGELGAETALIRTLLTYLGESQLGQISASEGFIFSAEETLPGYIGNLKKLGNRLKDEDTKAFHAEYIDFLETLQQELEIAEQLAAIGKQYKPVKSLQKAAKIFPQMESVASKHTNQAMSHAEIEAAKQEASEKQKLIFFQRKVKQQKDNIERTFQAMLGRSFTKKDEQKGIYSFYNPDEYEERANNFEGMVNWLENDVLGGASDEELAQAQPILDLLKKITASIRSTGSTGQLDLETIREAESLLGIDLKEFDLLFKEFEKEGKTSIDVNRYKDELRTIRRNRDQILNEKAVPPKVNEKLDNARQKIQSVDTEAQSDVEMTTSELQSAFSEYLRELVRKGTEYGTNILRENASQIQGDNFNEAQITRQFNELNEEFKKAAKAYRQAVNDGNNNLAVELAENLLFQSASLKRIYSELVGQIENEDNAKSIRGFISYLTSVQTEIGRGQPNLRGRVGTGLIAAIADNPDLEARVREIDFGSDIRAGVEKIINRETGEEIGYQFVLGINEGGQDAADIRSPSKVWQWIGNMVKAGFEGGVAGIGDFLIQSLEENADTATETLQGVAESVSDLASELDDSEGLLDPLLETEGTDEAVNDFFGGLVDKVSEVFDKLTEKFPILGRLGDLLLDVGGELLQFFGLFTFGEALIQFSNDALAAAMQMESLERSIMAVSRSTIAGANNIKFIRDEARRLSIDLITAEEAYKRILGATRNTPLEGLQTQQIFSTLATTAKNRGLNADATSRLFLGFEQVIAKGEFKAEEVRGQLAEVLGDIQNLLATSVGVPTSQLSELMEAGDLKAVEVMPKLLAQLDAQNAAIGDSAGTAAAAQTRFNNALLEYQDSVGRQLQPVQKLGLNNLAAALELLRDRAAEITKLVTGLVSTVIVNLTLKLLATKLATVALGDAIYRLGFAIGAMLPKLAIFLKRFVAITAAIEVWSNVIKLARNPLPELRDEISASTKRLEALKKAFDDTSKAAENYAARTGTLELHEGAEVGDNKFLQFIAGGDRWNFDNLIRNRIQRLEDALTNTATSFYEKIGLTGYADKVRGTASKNRTVTQAQRKQNTFIAESTQIIKNSDRTLTYGDEARKVLDEIAVLDAKARDLQSQRLNILPGDAEGLKAALAKEQELQKERDKLLKKSSQYAESIQGDIQSVINSLSILDELDKTKGTPEEIRQRANSRKTLETRLKLLKDEKKAIDEINSRIPKFLSEVDRLVRNSSERVSGFIANQEDDAVVNQTEAIKDALVRGLSDTQLEIKLDDLSRSDLQDRIGFIQKEINSLESKLESAYLQEGIKGLERAAAEQGLELTPDTLNRMLEEGRSSQETKAAQILLALDEYEGLLAQSESELVNLLRSKRSRVREFNRTISDYFFRINQQIKEATLEGQRLLSQVFYTDIKNRLRSAIAPGSNTFVNGIIDNIQSVIDQASQIAQKVFGDRAAELGFESETRTLATEMQDFIRQIGNAGDAVENFVRRLNGSGSSEGNISNGELSKEGSEVAKNALSWQGKHFREGVYAMCAGFVRQVLKDSGVDIGVTKNPYDAGKQPHNGELMARSFFGSDIGTVFKDKSQAKPGDIVGFFDTYQYGQKPGAITHVGIYQGNDMIVDRSTSSAPVRHRSIDTFGKGNYIFVRPHQYQDFPQPVVSNGGRAGSQVPSNNIQAEAVKQNQKLLALKKANLEITKATTEQEREALAIQVEQTIEANKRQADQGRKENARNLLGLETKFADFGMNYDYQSAAAQADSALRQIQQQFLDADLDIVNQIRNTKDAIATINKAIPTLTAEIAKFKAIGTPEALAAAEISQASLDELTKSLPQLEANLTKIEAIQASSGELEAKYTKFVESQNQLKIQQEQLNKRNLLLTQQATVAEARGTIEAQRKVKAHQEDLRLYLRENELRQQYAPGEYLDSLIAGERRQSGINQDNINYQAQLDELNLEKRLLDLQTEITNKRAGILSRFGLNFGAEKLKRDNAIASENLRHKNYLTQIQKELKDQPELLEKFTRRAEELNSVNLRSIENEFKSLGNTVQETFVTATQGFFSNFTAGLFDGTGQREKAESEERLRYAEELVNLESQYKDQPGKLAHLKNRARELNEQKLDKINNEFNIFKRGVNIAKQALLDFTKQLAATIAQAAAAKFISSILGNAIGGATGGGISAVGNDFGSNAAGVSAFVADKGATVGERKINDGDTSVLRRTFPAIKKAWKAEGEGARLGVFHVGEELLSRKTGEAGRYQMLKSKLGINPLEKIFNYAEGGTIGVDLNRNLLSGFPDVRPRIDLSALKEARGVMSDGRNNNTINIATTVVTPDYDSFRLNEEHRNQDLIERLNRGI